MLVLADSTGVFTPGITFQSSGEFASIIAISNSLILPEDSATTLLITSTQSSAVLASTFSASQPLVITETASPSVATIAVETGAPSPTTTSTSNPKANGSHLTAGEQAAIAVPVVIIAIALLVLAFIFARRRRRQQEINGGRRRMADMEPYVEQKHGLEDDARRRHEMEAKHGKPELDSQMRYELEGRHGRRVEKGGGEKGDPEQEMRISITKAEKP